ncbi:N-acetylmuramoyl-L-alanine amidase [Zunongwangia pacifica]|uniref:N-acetylmuramoyl-L-alanine amidase n=1 Tax=Zunongwangia pacifica TaxID=2911062 RepID=A0A9X1ZR49_9FLAO|nr:peptidoglycan recognition family protein [Zunongwangia pacifica]MCL6218424.1 peptidoglycan recognition protein family protein [Zunongwangia pacifica]
MGNFGGINKSILLFLLIHIAIKSVIFSQEIIDKPIQFSEERKQLSLEYLETHYDIKQEEPIIMPRMIVLHWTAIPSFEESFKAFDDVHLPDSRAGIKDASTLNVSTQFLVDRDGQIYRLMPETFMARHVIGLNHVAIGVENVGGKNAPLTKAQLKSNIWLVNYLKAKYETIVYLIGHYEYKNFESSDLWLENDDTYRTDKIDPGVDFMNKVRAATKNLKLRGAI